MVISGPRRRWRNQTRNGKRKRESERSKKRKTRRSVKRKNKRPERNLKWGMEESEICKGPKKYWTKCYEMFCSLQLVGPLKVIEKVKAKVDCKGGRNDLSFKQGDSIDILRIKGNPEGRWLARNQDGTCEYQKTLLFNWYWSAGYWLTPDTNLIILDGEAYRSLRYCCLIVWHHRWSLPNYSWQL